MKQTCCSIAVMLALALLVSGCGGPGHAPAETVADPLVGLPDTAPADGMCAGWQKSLAKGRRLDEVESCLRKKALNDRPGAVEEARELMGWEIREDSYSELKPLIAALAGYPEAGNLEHYLRSLSLLPNESGEYSRFDEALTASDYLRELGNIHWFDVETGMFPNQHDLLLRDLAALGDLGEITFSETPPSGFDSDDQPYVLGAEVNGTLYQRKAENYGDWYDLEAVLLLLNQVAVDQSANSRFVTLATYDQTAIVWAVDDQVLNQLIDKGLVSLSPAERSMQTGKAFEAAVLKELEER